jgi:hypothetical protein
MQDAKQIDDFPEYFITPDGKVYSSKSGKTAEISGSLWQGYRKVALSNGKGQVTTIAVHRLVAQHFLSEKPEGSNIVNHIDGNKSNNHVSNLEWTNHKGNMKHYSEKLSKGYVQKAKDKKQMALNQKLSLIKFAHELFKEDHTSFHKICTVTFGL